MLDKSDKVFVGDETFANEKLCPTQYLARRKIMSKIKM